MKNIVWFILLLIPVSLFSQEMNIISFNIRYNTPSDGKNAWPNRIKMVTDLLRFHDTDIFGLQEALHGQIIDIKKNLPEYDWIGVGRDDGKQGGEFSPVFYNKLKLKLLKSGTFWLSETPEKPSIGWDAMCSRVVTWGHFEVIENGKDFFLFNTHFDHRGNEARRQSAILIREKIEEMTYKNNLPVILTGDLNLTPDKEPISLIKKYLTDCYDISKEPPYGPVGTYNGFNLDSDLDNRIDYIFVRGNLEVVKYAALSEIVNKRYPSDHLPVYAKIQLN